MCAKPVPTPKPTQGGPRTCGKPIPTPKPSIGKPITKGGK